MDQPDVARVLRKLRDRAGRSELKPAGLTKATAATFAEAGYLRLVLDGKKTLVELLDKGREHLEALEKQQALAPKPEKAKARPKAPPQAQALAVIQDKLDEVLMRLGRIEAAVVRKADGSESAHADLPSVKKVLLDTIAELDAARRYGGLVPIPEIRKAVEDHDFSDETVTTALEELEQEYVIDLNVAQASTAVADRRAGIERPGRGLLYYVARRTA
jgi:hypothetical protein